MSGNINPYPGQEGSPGHQKATQYVGTSYSYEPVINATSSFTPTIDQSSAWFTLNSATGLTATLPSGVQVGTNFTFVIQTSVTSNSYKITTGSASIYMQGTDIVATVGGTSTIFQANGTSHTSFNMNGTTTGGLVGSIITCLYIGSNQWQVTAQNFGSGTLATSFSATP